MAHSLSSRARSELLRKCDAQEAEAVIGERFVQGV